MAIRVKYLLSYTQRNDPNPFVSLFPDLVSAPIPVEVGELDLESETGFKGGDDFISEGIERRIIVWGGWKNDPNVVHVYDIDTRLWTRVSAAGDVHPGSHYAASAVLDNRIYLFGGRDHEDYETNCLSVLNVTGYFLRIAVVGDSPSPRFKAVGWTYGNHTYFGFGYSDGQHWWSVANVSKSRSSSEGDSSAWTRGIGKGRTNETWKFDPRKKSFSPLTTSGSPPEPRYWCAVARLGSKVYVLSGWSEDDGNDFFQLDLLNMRWSRISDTGFSSETYGHSLSVISPSQLLRIGGQYSNKYKIFNVDNSSWTENQRLPAEVSGQLVDDEQNNYFYHHQAVEVQTDGRVVKIICLGGSARIKWIMSPSKYILEFDVDVDP